MDSGSTQEYLNINITTNLNPYHTERRFPSTISILSLKGKLELLTGGNMKTMKLELRDKDKNTISKLTDDSMSLAECGIQNGMVIHVTDEDPIAKLEQESEIDFGFTDEDYAKREDTARLFLMKNNLGKYDGNKIKKKEEDEANETALAPTIPVGSRCEVSLTGAPSRRGVVKYVGKVHFKPGDWVGVEYDEPVGKNDGQIEGKRYFECRPKYGGFVRPSTVKVGDYPEFGLEDLDEI